MAKKCTFNGGMADLTRGCNLKFYAPGEYTPISQWYCYEHIAEAVFLYHIKGYVIIGVFQQTTDQTAEIEITQLVYEIIKAKGWEIKPFDAPAGYVPINSAPENSIIGVMWGAYSGVHQFGKALRRGDNWYIYSDPNPHGNGLKCATPTAWMPK